MSLKSWQDDTVDHINKIIKARSQKKREEAVDEFLDYIEDLLLMTYIKGKSSEKKKGVI